MSSVKLLRYVVRKMPGAPADAVFPSIGTGTTSELLPSREDGWVMTVPRSFSGRSGWQALQAQLSPNFLAIPVLDDGQGGERFPTGRISVRFRSPVTDVQLVSFQRSAELVLVHRTKRTDRQAVFRPERPGQSYLPELVDELNAREGVDLAWLDAESAYRRSTDHEQGA